jgi:tetratricopeptide (TPR) repeat protein
VIELLAQEAAENLASALVKVGARRLGRTFLGTPAERAMHGIYARAIAGVLIEVGEAREPSGVYLDPEAMKVAETVLGVLCSDEEAAGLLLNVALRPGPMPVSALGERAIQLGYDPGTFPFDFDGAMWVLADKVYEEFVAEARKEKSPIQGLVNEELLASVRVHHEAMRAASTGGQGNLLPPPPGLVLGRAEELNRAKQALGVVVRGEEVGEPERGLALPSRRIAAVHGWPGIGKSTFVAALCRDTEVLEHFSEGVLFVPVGRSTEVRRLAEEVCAALGVPAPPGSTLEVLQGRIADALSQRSLLLIFDDVWEERHVAPLLLAGGNSAALVATRRLDIAARLSTGTKGPLKLGLLSEEDSLQLIASRAPGVVAENEGACRELAKALDGLPLALRVAADLLRVESEAGFNVWDLLEELMEAGRVLGEEVPHDVGSDEEGAEGAAATVRALLQKSIERMDQDTVRRFARLGVLPPKPLSFDPWTAQDVWRETAEDPDPESREWGEEKTLTRSTLGDLVRRGLVESAAGGIDPLAIKLNLRSKRPERFWMHALVAAFALETLERMEGETGVREAQQRRLEHYRKIVGAANEAAIQGGDTQYFGVLLMTLDLPNIRAAHEWARVRSSGDRRALEYLSHLPAQGPRALSERLAPGEFLDWMRLAEEAAREIGDEGEARSHRAIVGAALLGKGQVREALAYCEESRQAAQRIGDAVGEATALANLASIRNAMGAYEVALDLAERAETTLGNASAPDVLLGAIGQQAEALEGLGRLEEAEERYEARRDLAWEEGELSYYARALRQIARIKRERPAEWDEARSMFEEAAQVFWDLKQYHDYRAALNGLGVLELKARALSAAVDLFRRALSSAVEDDHKADQARATMNIGIAHQERGTQQGYEAAESEYRQAVTLASDSGEPDVLGDVLFNLAQLLYYHMDDYRSIRVEATSAAEAYRRAGSAKEFWVREMLDEIDRGGR